MLFDDSKPLSAQILQLQREGKLTTRLTAGQVSAIEQSVRGYAQGASESIVKQIAEEVQKKLVDLSNPQDVNRPIEGGAVKKVTEGLNPATAREELTAFLEDYSTGALKERLDFALDVGAKVANGAGRFVQQNLDQEVVDAYPALELERLFERDVPRGFRRGPAGELIEVPEEDWEARWTAAAEEVGDDDALRVFEETGRMMALKASPIWQALGDGSGGYDDTLGNPYDPLAWNTGYRQIERSREEAEEVGLLEPGEKTEAAEVDFENLFAFGE